MQKRIYSLMFITLFVTVTLMVYSCKKEIKGCKDPDSTTYNSAATTDDGSCQYSGKIVFWYDQSTSDWLVNTNGSTSLTYKVDGAIVGSSACSVYFSAAPNCGQSGSITVQKSLGSSKNKSFSYSVEDDNGIVVWDGSLQFSGNTCTAFRLTH